MLDDMDMSYEEINIEKEDISRDDLVQLTGGYTVPQIIINDNPVGGFNELLQLNQTGKLKELLDNN
jgi:glutaredoxin 3